MQENIAPTTKDKDKYKVRNWTDYNKSLCRRGSLTLWLSESVIRMWERIDITKKMVGEQTYPNSIVECCLLLGMNYRLPLRQTTGFVGSLLSMLGKGGFAVPDYTTLCRRQGSLPVEISQRLQQGDNIDIAIDSTGLKLYGEGEWKVRKHGASKRRTWRKLHIGIEVGTQEIISVALTTNAGDDAATAIGMLAGSTGKLRSFRGDGGYDDFGLREVLGPGIGQIIPPPKDAVIKKGTKKKPLPEYLVQRNEAVSFIKEHGLKEWKVQNGYHKRSRNEVAMYRYKTTFGENMKARKMDSQLTEVKLKCVILNRHTQTGMPVSYKAE